jgi:hypothetical protein
MTRSPLAASAVVLVLLGCDGLQRPTDPHDNTSLPVGGPAAPSELWTYNAGMDLLGRPYATAVTEGGRAGAEFWYLAVGCRAGAFDVVIEDDSWDESTTEVRYSIDGRPEVSDPWVISHGLSTYRGDSPVAFAETLATSRTLEIVLSQQVRTGSIVRSVVFKLDGLAPHLPAVRARCGV